MQNFNNCYLLFWVMKVHHVDCWLQIFEKCALRSHGFILGPVSLKCIIYKWMVMLCSMTLYLCMIKCWLDKRHFIDSDNRGIVSVWSADLRPSDAFWRYSNHIQQNWQVRHRLFCAITKDPIVKDSVKVLLLKCIFECLSHTPKVLRVYLQIASLFLSNVKFWSDVKT